MTREFLELVREHREASYTMITEAMVNTPSLADVDMYKVSQYRGQVYALDLVLNIEELLKEKAEGKNEEVESTGIESDS